MNQTPTIPIVVIGSSNTDLVIKSSRLPKPGETVTGGNFLMNAGGKGANQAVAAARMGGSVKLVANIGKDLFGHQVREHLQREKIDISFLTTDENSPSGIALIFVDAKGENCISVAPGSNDQLRSHHVEAAFATLPSPAIVLLQMEIPVTTVITTIEMARQKKFSTILNPAPYKELPLGILGQLDFITPNEGEAERLTGIAVTDQGSAQQAAEKLLRHGVKNVIITMGNQGVFIMNHQLKRHIQAPAVNAVDTTGAGDCFNGAFAAGLAAGLPMEEAVKKAVCAATLSVTRMGAQAAMPFDREVNELLASMNSTK